MGSYSKAGLLLSALFISGLVVAQPRTPPGVAASAVKNAAIALAMIAAGGVLAYMHVASQVYYPVVRIASPDGVSYTALMDPTDDRRDCGAANERFLGPVKDQCKECKVVFARCERKSEAIDLAV